LHAGPYDQSLAQLEIPLDFDPRREFSARREEQAAIQPICLDWKL
jgi:hypothetical protein